MGIFKQFRKDTQKSLREEQPDSADLDAVIAEAMKQVPEPKGADEIEQLIETVTAEADMVFVHNPNAIKQYEERKAKLKHRVELESKKKQYAKDLGALQAGKAKWQADITPIVEQINQNF